MSGLAKKLVQFAVPLAILGTLLVGTPASAAPWEVCDDHDYGGRYYCDYKVRSFLFENETHQIFVIGTDFAVWTAWRHPGGPESAWFDLGGQIRRSWKQADFKVIKCNGQPIVQVVGTDNRWWSNARRGNGTWTGWTPGNTWICSA